MVETEFRVSLGVRLRPDVPPTPDPFDDLFHLLYHHRAYVLAGPRSFHVGLPVPAFDAQEALRRGLMLFRAATAALGLPSAPIEFLEVDEPEPFLPDDETEHEPGTGVQERCTLCELLRLGDHGDCLVCRQN